MDALNDPGRDGNHMEQDLIKSQFMFYFALENGVQCPNYMTEKLWDSLSRGSIPIYVGWDGIEDYIPSKESVIDLRDFNSVGDYCRQVGTIPRPTKSCTKKRTNGGRKTRKPGQKAFAISFDTSPRI